jgi:hypothetical protein
VEVGQECQLQLEKESASNEWQMVRKFPGISDNTMREMIWNTLNLIGELFYFYRFFRGYLFQKTT